MYAPKLQPYTKDERWKLGFDYRVDKAADSILAEHRARVDKALGEIRRVVKSVPYDNRMYLLQQACIRDISALAQQRALSPAEMQEMLARQMEGMRPAPPGPYGGILGGILGAIGGL